MARITGDTARSKSATVSQAPSSSQMNQIERKAGSIVRVTCHNFLTYRHMDVWPTPGLNLIIGPNGSGKSSLAAAIGLALGGTPKQVGRGCDIRQFIRHGCESAEIEVELFNPDGEKWVISRRIRQADDENNHKSGKSLCGSRLNGKPTSFAQVKAFTEALNIQIGNLVQFLPQERVAEFAKMNSQELLISTEKTLSTEEDLHALHEDLTKSKTDWTVQETEIQRAERDLTTCQRDLPALEEQFERYKQKNEQEVEYKFLKKVQRYLVYEEKRVGWLRQRQSKVSWNKDYTKTLKDSRALLVELKKSDEALAPSSTQAGSTKRQRTSAAAAPVTGPLDLAACKAQANQVTNLNAQAAKRVADENKSFEAYFEKISSVNVKFEEEQKKQENRQKRESTLMDKIKDVESSIILSQKLTLEQIKQQELALAKEETDTKNQRDALLREGGKKTEQKDIMKRTCQAKQSEIDNINQLLRRKEIHMQSVNKDVYNAYVAIQKYQKHENSPFKGIVYGPLFSELKPLDPQFETILESAIPFRDLIGFLCEDKADLKLLQDMLVKQNNLKINLFSTIEEDGADPYRHPVPINTLKLFDFSHYVTDLFDAPPAVKHFLTRSHMLAQQPVALQADPSKLEAVVGAIQQIENRRSQAVVGSGMRVPRFFFGGRRYEMNRSKYSGEMFTRSNQLPQKSSVVKYFDSEELHTAKRDRLTQDIADLDAQMQQVDADAAELRAQAEELGRKLESFKRERLKLRSLKEDRDRFETRKQQLEKELQEVRKVFVDLDAIKLRCDDERDQIISNIFDTFGKLDYISNHTDKSNNTMLSKTEAVFNAYVEITKQTWVQKDNQEKARAQILKLKEIRGARTNFAERIQKLEVEVVQAFGEFVSNAYRNKDGTQTAVLPAPVPQQPGTRRTQFLLNPPLPQDDQLLKWRVDHKLAQKNNGKSVQRVNAGVNFEMLIQEVHDKATTCQMNLDDLRGVQNVEAKLKTTRSEITRLTAHLEQLKANLDKAREGAGGKRDKWLGAINEVLGRLNTTFSECMERIGCRGGIELDIPEDADDFAKYGVKLSVAYRDNQQLHKLDACYQSGGERSVATALYLVALLRFTKCPFRCVDEINQGMDSTNERKVFDLVVEAAREDSGQYFVLTPKVLRGLNYGPDMNIIAVAHMKAGMSSQAGSRDADEQEARSSNYARSLQPPTSASERLTVPKFSHQQLAVYRKANSSISALVSSAAADRGG